MGKFFSALDASYRGRSYTIIGPRKSIEMTILTPKQSNTNNGYTFNKDKDYENRNNDDENNGNRIKAIEQEKPRIDTEQNNSSAIEKPTSSKCTKEQTKAGFSYKNSWKCFKELILPGSSCDEYRCPTIKERLEFHQRESHNKRCDCVKHKSNNTNYVGPGRRNSRVSIRSGPDYDQYSDQSLPTKEQNPLTKCREICPLKSSLVKKYYTNLDLDKKYENRLSAPDEQTNKLQESSETKNSGKYPYTEAPRSKYDDPGNLTNANTNSDSFSSKYSKTRSIKTDPVSTTEIPKLEISNSETRRPDYTQFAKSTNPESSLAKYTNISTTDDKKIKTESSSANNTNLEIVKPKYVNKENLTLKNENSENTKNIIAPPPKLVDEGTSPANDNTVNNYNDVDVYSNRIERKCSEECTTNPHNYHMYSPLPKDSPKQLALKIDPPTINDKYRFTSNSLIFERPLCADIYTSVYKDAFTDPNDSHVSPVRQADNFVRTDSRNNKDIYENIPNNRIFNTKETSASTCCNSNIFDTPTIIRNDNPNDCEVQRDDESYVTEKGKPNRFFKDNYTTTYGDAYNKVHNGYDGTNYKHMPYLLKSTDCSCSTNIDLHTQPNTSLYERNDNSLLYENSKLLEEPPCCNNPYPTKYINQNEPSASQRNNNVNQSTLHPYKSQTYPLDDVCSSETNQPKENSCEICYKDSINKLIRKKVEEWISEVPMFDSTEKGAKETFNKAVMELVKKLSRLSKNAENSEYNEQVRTVINTYLDKIPIWYPGAKREQEAFKRSIADRLIERLNCYN